MKAGTAVVWLGAIIFFAYGLAFAIWPKEMSDLTTQSTPQTSSGLIDMRATYGGMTMAIGVILALAARNPGTVKPGLWILIITMIAMAATRLLGMAVDGRPSSLMIIYLLVEILTAGLAVILLRRSNNGS